MNGTPSSRIGDLRPLLRMMKPLEGTMGADTVERNRQRIATILRAMGDQMPPAPAKPTPTTAPSQQHSAPLSSPAPDVAELAPRLQQTLRHLLCGDSEKQIAAKLALSR